MTNKWRISGQVLYALDSNEEVAFCIVWHVFTDLLLLISLVTHLPVQACLHTLLRLSLQHSDWAFELVETEDCCCVVVDVSACKPSCIRRLLDRVKNCAHCVMLGLSSGQSVSWNITVHTKRWRCQYVYAWDSQRRSSDILFDLRWQERQWPPCLLGCWNFLSSMVCCFT